MQNVRNYIETDQGLEIFTIPDFLTNEECDTLCSLIELNNSRSQVAGTGKTVSTYHQGRTSSTSNLSEDNDIVKQINKKICDELQISSQYAEPTQGQIYQVDQEFKHHFDYFLGDGYTNHCLSSGQRTYTFMIYLNDVEEGGETDFDKINYKFSPQKRMAVVWKNSNGSGSENSASHHAGMPVKKGKKIVITKWFRENHYNPLEDQKLSLMTHNNKTFSTYNDLPKYSSNGFKIIKCPSDAWNLIMEGYKVLKNNIKEEQFVGKEHVIKGEGNTSDLMSFDEIPTLRNLILEKLKPTHEEFCKENIEPVALYGIRSYNRGSTLINHRDRPQTHHVSSIIIVDKDLDCGCSPTKGTINDWPLDIQDHEGNWHQIYAEIGDMILYESAVCEHGRNQPFLGNWFRSCFAHYKLSDYQYIGSPNE